MTTTKLKHPTSKQSIEIEKSDAEPYLSQGWVEVETKTSQQKSDKDS